jgi:hypothetical protein
MTLLAIVMALPVGGKTLSTQHAGQPYTDATPLKFSTASHAAAHA